MIVHKRHYIDMHIHFGGFTVDAFKLLVAKCGATPAAKSLTHLWSATDCKLCLREKPKKTKPKASKK